jgi:hypothetical protein
MIPSNSSVRVRLRGGLGNQLSCFYAGLYLSNFNASKLLLDGRFIKFGGNTNRTLELNKLELAKGFEGLEFLKPIPLPKSRIGKRMVRPLLERTFNQLTSSEKSEVFSDSDSFLGRKVDFDVTLDGYFPTFEYFDACKEMGMVQEMHPADPSDAYLKTLNEVKSQVCVHIRMGDYLEHPETYPILSNEYYENALQKTSARKTGYHIFAEDLSEATKRFPKLIDGATDKYSARDFSTVETFCLMANSSQIVTANSSYSTWAAKFVDLRGGLVACPERMFNYDAQDLRPTNWLRIG